MAYNDRKDSNNDRAVQQYVKYLNGPMGKRVMENLHEGESFEIETKGLVLRVTKTHGKAIVDIVRDSISS
ncbi:MAG: hypothetical protein ACFFD6_10380 [Candidatus Thorarchaeota archaeon]